MRINLPIVGITTPRGLIRYLGGVYILESKLPKEIFLDDNLWEDYVESYKLATNDLQNKQPKGQRKKK